MGGRLQTMKDTKCPIFLETFDCDKDAPTDCTIDKPERPDKEDFEDLSDEEKAQLKSDIRGKMTEFKEKMQKCVCCNVISVEDIIAAKEEAGEGFRLFDSREGETGGMSEGEDGGFGGGRPSSSSMMSGTSGEGEGEGRPSGMSGGRPGGGMSGARPEGMDIDAMLAQICPKFDTEHCSSIESSMTEEINCNEMNASTRGGRKKKMLYCACCD